MISRYDVIVDPNYIELRCLSEFDNTSHQGTYDERRKSFTAENIYHNGDFPVYTNQSPLQIYIPRPIVEQRPRTNIQDPEPTAKRSECYVVLETRGEEYGFELIERTRKGSQVN